MKIPVIHTISELHRLYEAGVPRHPLVSVLDLKTIRKDVFEPGMPHQMDFYVVACKKFKGAIRYGRSVYDFEEGSVMFTAPHQVVSTDTAVEMEEGWALFFHPDLIHSYPLARKMHEYSFFHYDVNEALQVSEEEKELLYDCAAKITKEISQNIDKHTQHLIVSNIELLLSYCSRFYDRQFLTREKSSKDIVQRFERLLHEYFNTREGLPDVKYFASVLNLSPNYLTDLLQKYTGKSTQEHIHLHLIDKAKSLLIGTEDSISAIAYELGFEHVSNFSRLFKAKTGVTPGQLRSKH